MRLRTLIAFLACAAVTLPAVAAAQEREPAAGSVAAGADIGFLVADDKFHVGFTPSATVEFYVTDRVSVRALAGWSRNRFIGTLGRYQEQFRGGLNVVYNWEADRWHPFVTAGAAAHHVRLWQDKVESSGWDTRRGISVGGGIEYFARPKVTIKAEGLYHLVRRADSNVADLQEAYGFAISVGLKKYF